MQSKRPFFSKTVFLKNITHYWPIWSCWLLVCLYRLPFRIYVRLSAEFKDVAPADYDRFLEEQFLGAVYRALNPILLFLFAAITAIALFSYLYQARSAHMMHALPLSRESLFLTNLSSGLCFLIIPQLISFLVSIFVCFFLQMTHLEGLLHWLLLSLGMTLTAFGLGAFSAMITGHSVAAIALFFLLNYGFVAIRSQVLCIFSTISYGMTLDLHFGSMLSPLYFLVQTFGIGDFYTGSGNFYSDFLSLNLKTVYLCMGIYVTAALVLFLLTYLVYRRKHLETAGDIITVDFLRPVIRWGAAFALGSFFAYMLGSILQDFSPAGGDLFPLVPLLVLAELVFFYAAEMVLQKNFRVFKKRLLVESGILAAVTLVFVLFVHTDLFRFERRIPAVEDIASVSISGDYPLRLAPEDYGKILAIHQEFLDAKKETQKYFNHLKSDACFSSIDIYYQLKNGSAITRRYYYPTDERYLEQEDYVIYQIMELSNRPEYYLQYHFTDAFDQLTFVDGTLDVYVTGNYLDSQSLNQAQCAAVYNAFRKNVEEGNYRIYNYALYGQLKDKLMANILFLNYTVPAGTTYVSYHGEQQETYAQSIQSTAITLTADCEHTLKALEELGVISEERRMITEGEYELKIDDSLEYEEKVFHQ